MPSFIRFYILLFLCAISIFCQAQKTKVVSGDTSIHYKSFQKKVRSLKLPELISSTNKLHFRLWFGDAQVIDIWTRDSLNFQGTFLTFVNHDRTSRRKINAKKMVVHKVMLDTLIARKIIDMASKIESIPDSKKIKGWSSGFDGTFYLIERSTARTYEMKTYPWPESQVDSVKQGRVISNFLNQIDSLLTAKETFKSFLDRLEPGSYSYGITGIIRFTPEYNKYRERTAGDRQHVRVMKDTLNKFLTDTLKKVFSEIGYPDYEGTLRLTFSQNNELIWVDKPAHFSDREEKQQFLNTREKLFKVFKTFRANFMHSKIGYIVEFELYKNKLRIDTSLWF